MRRPETTKALAFTFVALLGLPGCQSTKQSGYADPNEVETVDINYSRTDLKKVTADLVKKFLASDPVADWGAERERPAIALRKVQNRSDQHVDTKAITDKLRTALTKSRKFIFTTERENLADTADTLENQQDGATYDQKTAAKKGGWRPPEFILRGRFYSITKQSVDRGKTDVYYLLTVYVDSLEGSATVWSAESEIAKSKERASFGY